MCNCKCNKEIIDRLDNIQEQVRVLTEEYDLLNRYVYEASDEIEYR